MSAFIQKTKRFVIFINTKRLEPPLTKLLPLPVMKKLFSLSLFFFLGFAPVHASQNLSSYAPLELRPEKPAYFSLEPTQTPTCSSCIMGAEDSIRNSCLEAVAAGDLQKLHYLLWDHSKSKSETVVYGYCAKAESQVQILPEIKRLISNFVCLFEDDANEIKYENGVTLLHTACMFPSRQSIAIVAFILSLKNIDVNAQHEYGHTALHYLCEHRCPLAWEEHVIEILDLIMKQGGSCKVKNCWQDNPLHTLFKYRFSATPLPLDVLKRFKGKVMNEVNASGMTPLHIACDYNRLSQYSNPKSTCMRRLWIDVKRVAYYRKWKRTGCVEGIRYLLTHGGAALLTYTRF